MWKIKSSHPEVFCKKYVLKNFTKIKLQASSLNFAKFLGTPFFQRTLPVAAFVRSTDIFLETKCPIYSSTHSGQL